HARPRRGRGARGPRRHPRPRAPAVARADGCAEGRVRRRDARGGVLLGDRPLLRGRGRGRGERGVRMRAAAATGFRYEAISLGGVVERNWYLIKRYFWWELAFFIWSLANTLSIVYIAKGVNATGGSIDVNRATTTLLIGAVVWAYLGIVFEFMTETVAWERWEGTIEYTFMAPLRRPVHLFGVGSFAVIYALIRSALLFVVVPALFGLHMPGANFAAAGLILFVSSASFMGVGTMTSLLP